MTKVEETRERINMYKGTTNLLNISWERDLIFLSTHICLNSSFIYKLWLEKHFSNCKEFISWTFVCVVVFVVNFDKSYSVSLKFILYIFFSTREVSFYGPRSKITAFRHLFERLRGRDILDRKLFWCPTRSKSIGLRSIGGERWWLRRTPN